MSDQSAGDTNAEPERRARSRRSEDGIVQAINALTDASEAQAVIAAQQIEVSKMLVSVTDRRAQQLERTAKSYRWVIIIGSCALFLLGLNSLSNRSTLQTVKQQGEAQKALIVEVKKQNAQLKDCLDPSGECAQKGKDDTNTAILSIIDTNKNGIPDTQEILDRLGN